MGLYNFQPRFVPYILDGSKTHTIRAERVNPDKPGNTLHLHSGLPHRGAKCLMRVPCVKVESIVIAATSMVENGAPLGVGVCVDGNPLTRDECEQLAKREGFASFEEMMAFWKGRLPFRGSIIHWKNDVPGANTRVSRRRRIPLKSANI